MSFVARLEIAWIVEDVVFGQQCFVSKPEQLLIANDGRGVVKTPAGGEI